MILRNMDHFAEFRLAAGSFDPRVQKSRPSLFLEWNTQEPRYIYTLCTGQVN
jgi:hypothetical protein